MVERQGANRYLSVDLYSLRPGREPILNLLTVP
ncbi:MAG: hypothetical protein RLZZ352_903 [Pseudomonadota bacterium]|jgi:hypothetical protein